VSIFTIVYGDDWTGLYADGSLLAEGHSLSTHEVLDWARSHGPVAKVEEVHADTSWLEDCGNLPGQLREVRVQK